MSYDINIMPNALKFLKKQDKNQQERLLKSIKALPSNGDIILEIGNRGDIYK